MITFINLPANKYKVIRLAPKRITKRESPRLDNREQDLVWIRPDSQWHKVGLQKTKTKQREK